MNAHQQQIRSPERRSRRLDGFDYTEPGSYFVTVCTRDRQCFFGEIIDGRVALSPAGKIVDACWREIPDHFPHVRVHVFQVMPNHVHGIVEIVDHVGTRHAVSLHDPREGVFGRPQQGSLSIIIGAFKSAATKRCHAASSFPGRALWQPRFHDRVIRDDREHFFIEQYITLNPLLWYYDPNNPGASHISTDELRQELRQKHRLDEYTVECLLEQIGV